jgi:LysM domain
MVSVARRVAPFLLLVIAALPAMAQQSSRPPRDLHRVGDHWTAYNPPDPATYPAGARTHEIKAGDTLWDLAVTYYGNGYLWPQLWESNTWITDAHWIYPGDVLLVEGEATQSAEAAGEEGALSTVTPLSGGVAGSTSGEGGTNPFATSDDGGIAVARVQRESRPIPLGTESDIYCYGYIGHPEEPMPNFIASAEDVEVKYVPRATNPDVPGSLTVGELVYVTGGAATGLVAGEDYLIVEPTELIRHPETDALIGRQYDYIGQIRILCIEGERSRAIITQACREIQIGNRLKPIPQLPIPIARVPELPAWCDPPSGRVSGHIVDSRGWELGLSEGNLVQIDLGRDDQVSPGDFLTVFRPSPRADQPRQVLGQIGILTTEARTATAIVLTARREMLVGDQVELR